MIDSFYYLIHPADLIDKNDLETNREIYLDRLEYNLDEKIESLILEAEDVVQDSAQIYGFTKLVKDTYENDRRIELIEMLWEVVFADGKADAFEQNLIQRVAGLIFVSDKDRGLARKRVIDRLGINA